MAYVEKAHASACGVMFRADRKCTCAVGEVERLRDAMRAARALFDDERCPVADDLRELIDGALRDA